jgi:hypothetical protein
MPTAFNASTSPEDADAMERLDLGQLSLQEGLVRELLQRAKSRPDMSELFEEGCLALTRVDQASRLPLDHESRATALVELVAVHRKLLDQMSLMPSRAPR